MGHWPCDSVCTALLSGDGTEVTRAVFISILAKLVRMTARRLLFTRASAQVLTAYLKRLLLAKRASGTNGWMSSWGTNAHGEIAGCPPPRS